MISSIEILVLLIRLIEALITSVKLCGGILVAVPTAIPEEPFIKRFGIFVGRTSGMCSLPSSFSEKAPVSFSRSASI